MLETLQQIVAKHDGKQGHIEVPIRLRDLRAMLLAQEVKDADTRQEIAGLDTSLALAKDMLTRTEQRWKDTAAVLQNEIDALRHKLSLIRDMTGD